MVIIGIPLRYDFVKVPVKERIQFTNTSSVGRNQRYFQYLAFCQHAEITPVFRECHFAHIGIAGVVVIKNRTTG